MYVDEEQLVERYGQREIDRLKKHVNDPNVIEAACQDADSIINSYVSVRYVTPLNPAPVLVLAAASDIARYKLWQTDTNEEVRERYKNAILWLKDIASGKASLIQDDGSMYPEQNTFATPFFVIGRPQIFTDALFNKMPFGGIDE